MDLNNQGVFTETVSSFLERKVRGWLVGVIDDMRRNSPVQQWLDSLPADPSPTGDADESEVPDEEHESLQVSNSPPSIWKQNSLDTEFLTSTPAQSVKSLQRGQSLQSDENLPKKKNPLLRDYSLQSDGSNSSGSSVQNVLGSRNIDAEEMLLAIGFGPSEKQQQLQRIPERFLKPSKLKGISTEKFIKDQQQSMRLHECGIFGYRGLTGNPHVPPSTIVAKIMECISKSNEMQRASPQTPIAGYPGPTAYYHR